MTNTCIRKSTMHKNVYKENLLIIHYAKEELHKDWTKILQIRAKYFDTFTLSHYSKKLKFELLVVMRWSMYIDQKHEPKISYSKTTYLTYIIAP